jgi:hypothetical protein
LPLGCFTRSPCLCVLAAVAPSFCAVSAGGDARLLEGCDTAVPSLRRLAERICYMAAHGSTSVMRSFRPPCKSNSACGVERPPTISCRGLCIRRRAASDEAQRRACACCSATRPIAMNTVTYCNEPICQPSQTRILPSNTAKPTSPSPLPIRAPWRGDAVSGPTAKLDVLVLALFRTPSR